MSSRHPRLLIVLAFAPTAAYAAGGPASALSGLQSLVFALAAGLFLISAVISCWVFYRQTPEPGKKWWLLLLVILGSAVAAAIGAVTVLLTVLFVLFSLET